MELRQKCPSIILLCIYFPFLYVHLLLIKYTYSVVYDKELAQTFLSHDHIGPFMVYITKVCPTETCEGFFLV